MNFKNIKIGVILFGLVLGLGVGTNVKAENIKRVSIASDGTQGNSSSFQTPSINYNGTVVAFQSLASNLITNDTNNAGDIFMHDIQTGTTTLASISSSGIQSNNSSVGPVAIDAGGDSIAFMSSACTRPCYT